nr:MAG TPA: hypothetical protein [Caudoviricetes sp.]
MKSEDGTGSRHPSWRCGNVTPPISFVSKVVTSVATFFIYLRSCNYEQIILSSIISYCSFPC